MVKVLSLGGSLIIPDNISYQFLEKFKKLIKKYAEKEKIIIVCGGGQTARKYINALEQAGISEKIQSYIGIRATRLNAWFLINFFKDSCNKTIPKSIKEVNHLVKKNNIVILGGLRYHEKNTSDGAAASLAKAYKTEFINMTNIKGLYNKHPKLKGAKFIPKITFSDFSKLMSKVRYKPGQHHVLDQNASDIIKKYKITTYIIGPDLKNLERVLENKKFTGTVIN